MVEWGELFFKVVRMENAGQEVLARAGNFMVARAAFDTSVSLRPTAEIELRQGARVIHSSKQDCTARCGQRMRVSLWRQWLQHPA
jgi:hypothetical protein